MSSPTRTTQMVTGWRSVPSRRSVAMSSSSADPILVSSLLVHVVIGLSPDSFACFPLLRLETRHPLHLFGIPVALHRDRRRGALDLAQVAGCQFHLQGAQVLVEARQF